MAISLVRPVAAQFPITGEYLQADGYWTPDRPHLGVDFGCPTGTEVRSVTQTSKVHAVHRPGDGWGDGSFGNCVVMDVIDTPWYYLYAHLSAVLGTVGETFEPGDLLAKSGATGTVTGPHLHVQVCTSPDFPRNPALMGDPILGLRNQPELEPEEDEPTLAELAAAHASLNKVVGDDRIASQSRDRALDSRVAALEAVIAAMVKAAPKG